MGRVVQVDLFFYREPEESKDRDEEEAAAPEFAPVEYSAPTLGLEGQWGPEGAEAAQWEQPEAAAVPVVAPATEWVAPGGAPVAAGWDVGAAPAAPAGWDTATPAGWEGTAAPAPQWDPAAL